MLSLQSVKGAGFAVDSAETGNSDGAPFLLWASLPYKSMVWRERVGLDLLFFDCGGLSVA